MADDRQQAEQPQDYTSIANDEIVRLVYEFKELYVRHKADGKRLEEIKRKIGLYMERSEMLSTDDGEVLLTYAYSAPALKFDKDSFEKVHPNLYEEFLVAGDPVRRFLIK